MTLSLFDSTSSEAGSTQNARPTCRPTIAFCFLFATSHCFFSAAAAASDMRGEVLASFTKEYCIDCHNGQDAEAGLSLEDFGTNAVWNESKWDSTAWEKIVRRLRARQMPPTDSDRPSEAQYGEAMDALESILDESADKLPRPGHTEAIRRLTRTEYANAIRDLLAFDVDANSLLPSDESSHGFDNVTVGELSPVLLSRYVSAAEQISRMALGSSIDSPVGMTKRVPADLTQDAHVEGLPLGTRGGTVFEFQFPVAGEYELQFHLTRDRDEHIEGLYESHDVDVLVDRELIHRFTVSPDTKSAEKGYEKDDTLVDANLKIRFRMSAGPHRVGVTFPQKSSSLSEIHRQPFEASFNRHRHPRREPAILDVSIVGPLDVVRPKPDSNSIAIVEIDTPSRRKIFSCTPATPDEANGCAEKILRKLMRIAYRRPLSDEDLTIPMDFFEKGFREKGFEFGIESALSSILVNPFFLFRVEDQPSELLPGTIYRISDLELASRLSFFLWSSIPDDELLDLAEQDRLHDPAVLLGQVTRMLDDARSQSLITNFASQWLYLRNLESLHPDMRLFPDFDDNLRAAMKRETEMLFERVLREDRSVLELLNSDVTFLNERLARHYGIQHVIGSQFRPVKLPKESSHRGGLLRHASILAVTSYATRTSPTIRGNWILGNIFGTPPPPPPPNVPALKDKTESAHTTIRERLAQHRANEACAVCHNLMDPVGFSFENYDAIGRWRIFDDGQPIDASGALPDGSKIENFVGIESSLLQRPELFVGTMTEKLLTFALGRGFELNDAPAVRKIVRESTQKDFRFSSLITGIVISVPFQMRVAE